MQTEIEKIRFHLKEIETLLTSLDTNQPNERRVLLIDCHVTKRLYNAIKKNFHWEYYRHITLNDIVYKFNKRSIMTERNIGVASIKELNDLLRLHGLSLPD